MKKSVVPILIALLCIAAFACNSVRFLAHPAPTPTSTATRPELTSIAAPELTDIPTPQEPATPTKTSVPEGACGGGQEGVVQVRWFIGLGTGTDPMQVRAEQAVADEFNASQDRIRLVLEVVPYDAAKDALATEIAAGEGPDIIGPVG